MTVKEMLKKVESYNEICKAMHIHNEAELKFFDNRSVKVPSYKEFKRWINEEYVNEIADAILKFDGFEFEKEHNFVITNRWGDNLNTSVVFYVATK